jgi:hypothetical protein
MMTTTTSYYFLRLQPPVVDNNPALNLEVYYQHYLQWLLPFEQVFAAVSPFVYQQYDQRGATWLWSAQLNAAALLAAINPLLAANHTLAALDRGAAVLDVQRHWCCSPVPQRLPALIQAAQHYAVPLVVAEAASEGLPKSTLQYLTRSYLAGATSALEIYRWRAQ